MRRDMDLVRSIVLAIEDAPAGFAPELEISGYSNEQIGYHVCIMIEGGLIHGTEITSMADRTPQAIPSRLTWQGHEFAAAIRNESRWRKAKDLVASKAGTVTMDVLTELLSTLMTDALSTPIRGGGVIGVFRRWLS